MAGDLDLAQECAQDAYLSALQTWRRDGIPRNPGAWLTTTARRKALDSHRRAAMLRARLPLLIDPGDTIDLAHSLGLRTVAEGVETGASYMELTRLGCDQAQGFFMSRAVPAAELDHWLRNRPALDQSTDIPNSLPTAALG